MMLFKPCYQLGHVSCGELRNGLFDLFDAHDSPRLSTPHRKYGDVTCRGCWPGVAVRLCPIVDIEERGSPPSSRRLGTRADVGATPAPGAGVPQPRPTAWGWGGV